MELLITGIIQAWEMLTSGDSELFQISLLTLKVSITAILFSTVIGIPLGVFLGLTRFPGRSILLVFIHIGMGLPPVVAGLWITIFLWRSGPLGWLSWLYTPKAIVLAQILVALPIIIGLTTSAFQQIDRKFLFQLKSLGATRLQMLFLLLKEFRVALLAAVMAGLGRILAEVGAAMMVGGNLRGETRILTTSIVMEVSKGNFDVALALSFILMAIAFLITLLLTLLQQRRSVH